MSDYYSYEVGLLCLDLCFYYLYKDFDAQKRYFISDYEITQHCLEILLNVFTNKSVRGNINKGAAAMGSYFVHVVFEANPNRNTTSTSTEKLSKGEIEKQITSETNLSSRLNGDTSIDG